MKTFVVKIDLPEFTGVMMRQLSTIIDNFVPFKSTYFYLGIIRVSCLQSDWFIAFAFIKLLISVNNIKKAKKGAELATYPDALH